MGIKKFIVGIASAALLAGCMGGAPQVDPMGFQVTPADQEKVIIPGVCRSEYESSIPKIAVLDFVNNSTFGKMTATNTNIKGTSTTNRRSATVFGAVGGPGFVVGGAATKSTTNTKFSTNVNSFMREITPSVAPYTESVVESTLVEMGGIEIFERKRLQKVMNEQQFQMAVANPDTAVQFGQLAGVQYIIMGSVDNIAAKYVQPLKNDNNNSNMSLEAQLALLALKGAANTQTGWNINVELTVKMIDVATGQVLVNKRVSGREVGGSQPDFNPELVVMAAKKAISEAVEDIKPDFSGKFAPQGYITQLKGNKQIALVNLGSAKGIKPGDSLVAYDFMEIVDPMTNAVSCTRGQIPVQLIVSTQVEQNYSWVQVKPVKKSEGAVQRLKAGTLIKREKLKGQSFLKKLF